jgi:Ni,Fe-hydrogenase III small subunit
MVVFFRGRRNGLLTTKWPKGPDKYFDEFPAAVEVVPGNAHRALLGRAVDAAAACPTEAITIEGMPVLDRGRCILCGRCVAAAPDWFRSVHIRHVDAGSDGSDEWEVMALLNPVYDVHRLGIFFTASPRHADILLVTGIGTAGMVEPLRRTLDGMPRPTVVIAAGADAISGGLVGGGYTGGTGIGELVPVDVWIPGSPASPFSVLHAILLALGRLPSAEGAS